jgi:hypothetical protein
MIENFVSLQFLGGGKTVNNDPKRGVAEQWWRCHDAGRQGKDRGLRTYNLQFDSLAFELNSANLEVDANCGDVAFCIGIICKTEEEAGLEARDGELLCSKEIGA